MAHCLSILHEHNKKACFVNKKKSLEAYKATDFPCNFTDFYGKWGKWDKTVHPFLTLFQQTSCNHSWDHFISGVSGIQPSSLKRLS
jgi:hypothetical protein